MGRVLIVLSLIGLLLLEIGSRFFPADPVMWLANTSNAYIAARGILIVLLALLLITRPPRKLLLRLVIGLAAITVLGPVAIMTAGGAMPILDSLSLAATGMAMGIAALEINYDTDLVDIDALRRAKQIGNLVTLSGIIR